MITNRGKTFLKRYMAGQSGAAIGAISVGIGNVAASANDLRLQFEFARVPVLLSSYDFISDKVVFKGSLGEEVAGVIHEVGLWTAEADPQAGNQGSRLITSFDSDSEIWDGGTFDSASVRLGPDSLTHTPTASNMTVSTMSNLTLDLSDNSNSDTFVFAYNVSNANVATVKFKFRVDSSNYYEFIVTAPTAGYKITSAQKGSANIVGTPNWETVNELVVETTATSGGLASVQFDGIRIEDVDTVSPEYGLINRYVPVTPIVKEEGTVLDLEYTFNISA